MTSRALLECFYRRLGPENMSMDDQLFNGDVLRQPYEVLAKILDRMVEVNKQARKKQEVTVIVT